MSRELWGPIIIVAVVIGLWLFTRLEVQDREHIHQAGSHGGILVSLGNDRFHAEAVFDKSGTLWLYTLGRDETEVIDVDEQELTAHVRRADDATAVAIALVPERQEGDAPGRTSRFAGQLPDELVGQMLEVTIPRIRIARERYRIAFASPAREHSEQMPDKVRDEEERELYLVPAGKYTTEDIQANGNRTASQAFPTFQAKHDFNPQPGDPLCPVTRTKANPACEWVIGGEVYQFCCPPCIDEFVRLAKDDPERVLDASAYIQR